MKLVIIYSVLFCLSINAKASPESSSIIFFGDTISIPACDKFSVPFSGPLSDSAVRSFVAAAEQTDYQRHIQQIINFKEEHQLDDWLYYQLVRTLAEKQAPKQENYNRYTIYKYFIMLQSGYDVSLSISDQQLLFYVQTDENVYGIPYYYRNSQQFVCLNYHDFNNIDFSKHNQQEVYIQYAGSKKSFSYKINNIPDFRYFAHVEKQIQFDFKGSAYKLNITINKATAEIFKNYPIVDFETYFNIPMSNDAKSSIIPDLKRQVENFSQKEGIAFLLSFTQKAFEYKNDQENFGKEKHLSAEHTILSEYSDCDDRVALFYYLVKEIYQLPMIAILHPTHISVGVKLDKPIGKTIEYKGELYSYCDPTPQLKNLSVGDMLKTYNKEPFEVVYQYHPTR